MTDLPAASRQVLADALMPALVTAVRDVSCDDGATRKTVWRLFDGTLVESVLMRYFGPSGRGELGDEADADRLATRESTTRGRDRVTVCVSSQAGCGMNCPFCATGQAGLTRNLSAAEIVEQVVAARARWRAAKSRGSRPVVERGLHGHGRTAGELQRGARRRPPSY